MTAEHPQPTVRELGEFAVIAEAVATAGGGGDSPAVPVGTGDDAAVVAAPGGTVVVCTDVLVEGRHFRFDWSAPEDVGHKAIAQNAADIAAMGGRPTAFTVGLACPADTPVAVALGIQRGLAAGASAVGAAVVGGDLVQADQVIVAVTALGDMGGQAPVRRGGARPGDVLALAGKAGRSAAGLAALAAGHDGPETAAARAAHRRPDPPYAAGPDAARAGARAMIDVSDGLWSDAGHLARASQVTVHLDAGAVAELAADPVLAAAAGALGTDAADWVLGGGEDHGLLAAFAPKTVIPAGFTVIGWVEAAGPEGPGVVHPGRRPHGAGGWRSFDRTDR